MKPSLRILQIISSSATSGAEIHALTLGKRLAERGHHVELACPAGGWLSDEGPKEGLETHAISFGGLSAFRWLAGKLSAGAYDLVHSHLTRAAYVSHFATGMRGVPLVASVHVSTRDRAYRWVARRSNRVIAVSEFVRDVLLSSGVPAGYIDVVHNGTAFGAAPSTDIAQTRRELNIPDGRKLVGLVGRVCPEKGHDLALEAMPAILAAQPEAHLLCVGRFEERHEDAIRAKVEELGLSSRVTFTGKRADVARLIDATDFGIIPSTIEACPLVALETMARGKAVIAANVGGLPELVEDGVTGLLVPRDKQALASATIRLLENSGERGRMGARARQVIENRFTIQRMVDALETVYSKAISEPTPAAISVPSSTNH